jgi:hypothetical protein
MEHEIADHAKKAFNAMHNHEKSFWEKTKEVLFEILIIVFAVTFAALIERTREHYKEKAEAKEFVLGLRNDLKDEILQLQTGKNDMDTLRDNYTFLMNLNDTIINNLQKSNDHKHSFNISKFNTRIANGRYDGFKSSGKIQTIENDSLRNDILKYYEEDVPFVDFTENVFNANQVRLEDYFLNNATIKTQTLEGAYQLIDTYKCKLILKFTLGYSDAVERGYDKALTQAKKIQKDIDEEYH